MLGYHQNVTSFFIVFTSVITCLVWRSGHWEALLIGYPYKSYHIGEWYRCLTKGFIHADVWHLVFNMYALYVFGSFVESVYCYRWGARGAVLYVVLYLGGIVIAGLGDVFVHAHTSYYRSLGASAGVSAILLSAVLFNPSMKVLFYGLVPMPAWLYGMVYLLLSYYMIGSASGINHLSHFIGAVYGIVFTLGTSPDLLAWYIRWIATWFMR